MNEETYKQVRGVIRMLVRAREDFQAMRKRMDNRIGRKADGSDQDLSRMTARKFEAEDGLMFSEISDEARGQETAVAKKLEKAAKRMPVYEWLKAQKGVGPIAMGHILGSFDIYKATTVSKLWQYSGMNPSMIRGKKRVKVSAYRPAMGSIIGEYEDIDGKVDEYLVLTDTMIRGDRLTAGFIAPFDKGLRCALLGVLADGFIKAGFNWVVCTENEDDGLPDTHRSRREKKIDGKKIKDVPCRLDISCPYCKMYYDYKLRLANSDNTVMEISKAGAKPLPVAWKDAKPAHRDRAAKRYMIKQFLKDLYAEWRPLHGLEVRVPYMEEYLGKTHQKAG